MTAEERRAEIEAFMRYAFETWPRERALLGKQVAQRCSECVLSEKYTPLTNGICTPCRSAAAHGPGTTPDGITPGNTTTAGTTPGNMARAAPASLEEELDAVLAGQQGKARGRYDALVMFSGGKDSSLLLHHLRQRYPGLRLLALLVDNGFTSSVALANVRRVSAIIDDVDHLVIKPQASLFRNTFRYALTHLQPAGCYASVDRLAGDLAFDIGRNTAAAFGIPLLLHGGTRAQCEIMLGLFSYETPRHWETARREVTGGFTLKEIYDEQELKYWWDGSAWPEDKVPRVIFPFYAWQYDEQAVRREVVRLGLFEPGNDNPIISNNDLLPVSLAVDTLHLGYSGYEPEFAQLIREKKTDRSAWLSLFESVEYLAKRGLLMPGCIADTLGRLGLTHSELGLPTPDGHG